MTIKIDVNELFIFAQTIMEEITPQLTEAAQTGAAFGLGYFVGALTKKYTEQEEKTIVKEEKGHK